jgi:hypothetical protein
VTTLSEHPLRWVAPSPLWAEAARLGPEQATEAMRRPSILRFGSDSFMDDFLTQMETDPSVLGTLRAAPETWRGPLEDPPPAARLPAFERALNRRKLAAHARPVVASAPSMVSASAAAADDSRPPLKLYQPAHQRFYLIAACLVCGLPGLPDHTIEAANGERATFVIRRLLPKREEEGDLPGDPSDCDEYALLTTGKSAVWRKVALEEGISTASLVPGEEQLPLFPVTFLEADGRKRRLLAGLVPTGKREAYLGAPRQQSPAGAGSSEAQPTDPRVLLLQTSVTGPWKNLIEQAAQAASTIANSDPPDAPPDSEQRKRFVRETRERIQTGSWYTLLDLAGYLRQQLPRVWTVVEGGTPSPPLSGDEQAVVTALKAATIGGDLRDLLVVPEKNAPQIYESEDVPTSLAEALTMALAAEAALEAVVVPYDRTRSDLGWPGFIFPLADPVLPTQVPLATGAASTSDRVSELEAQLAAALPVTPAGSVPAPGLVSQAALDPRGSGWFVLRCVFERPNCGPLGATLVSAPSTEFQIAGFFDPDAPARPIRIGLPVDISPAGLRKFDKNTVFVMSDLLCGQIERMKGLTLGDLVRSVLPWPLHKDLSVPEGGPCQQGGVNVGMICSLSIPIITICALILLIIIVALLDVIFRWLPYFLICFPLPRLRAKAGV